MRLFLSSVAILFVSLSPAVAQDHAADVQTAFTRAQHLKHGINASQRFCYSGKSGQQEVNYSGSHPQSLR